MTKTTKWFAAILAIVFAIGAVVPVMAQQGSSVSDNELDAMVERLCKNLSKRLQDNLKIALFPMPAGNGIDANTAAYVVEQLEVQFDKQMRYVILNRAQIQKVIDEQKFQASDLVDEKTAVAIGKLLGAQVVIGGNISGSGATRRIVFRALEVSTGRNIAMAMETF